MTKFLSIANKAIDKNVTEEEYNYLANIVKNPSLYEDNMIYMPSTSSSFITSAAKILKGAVDNQTEGTSIKKNK